jgi:hypothetical protein
MWSGLRKQAWGAPMTAKAGYEPAQADGREGGAEATRSRIGNRKSATAVDLAHHHVAIQMHVDSQLDDLVGSVLIRITHIEEASH